MSMTHADERSTPACIDSGRHLLDLWSLTPDQIRSLLKATQRYLAAPARERFDTLAGRTVANLFFEDSTRTRVSFTLATRRLAGEVVDLSASGSSVSKGETAVDTAMTIAAMGVDVIVIRHAASGAAELVARAVDCSVINAGDGRHAHPTQGLLDAYTIAEAHSRLSEFDLTGLRIGIVGDLEHSRVARSDIAACTKLGAEVVGIGPADLAPESFASLGCSVSHDLEKELPTLDAVQMLRVQRERGASAAESQICATEFQLSADRAAMMKPDAVVLHPGPMNRGVEIASAVADGPRSRVLRQVAVGVAVRMATLEHVTSG